MNAKQTTILSYNFSEMNFKTSVCRIQNTEHITNGVITCFWLRCHSFRVSITKIKLAAHFISSSANARFEFQTQCLVTLHWHQIQIWFWFHRIDWLCAIPIHLKMVFVLFTWRKNSAPWSHNESACYFIFKIVSKLCRDRHFAHCNIYASIEMIGLYCKGYRFFMLLGNGVFG